MTITALQEIFPTPAAQPAPDDVLAETRRGEQVIWHGGPTRWGLFRATPFVVVPVGAFGYLAYAASASESAPWPYLLMLFETQSGNDALILPGLMAGFLVVAGLWMRDPRPRWTYVVTDQRLMTFYEHRKLREADAAGLAGLEVVQGFEGRLRNVGDVVWARIHGDHGRGRGGPDRGRHGFRGMRDPASWEKRLRSWRAAVERGAAADAGAFSERAVPSPAGAPPGSGARLLPNRKFAFEIAIPERWVGRIGLQHRGPVRLFGIELPIQSLDRAIGKPLHEPPAEWNFIEVQGRSGMIFTAKVNEGPPIATFETSCDTVGDQLIDADGALRCGPMAGYRVDYIYRDKVHVRYAMLEGDGFHMRIIVAVPPSRASDLLQAIDALFDSIRAS